MEGRGVCCRHGLYFKEVMGVTKHLSLVSNRTILKIGSSAGNRAGCLFSFGTPSGHLPCLILESTKSVFAQPLAGGMCSGSFFCGCLLFRAVGSVSETSALCDSQQR